MNKLVSGAIGVPFEFSDTDKIYFNDIAVLRNKRIKHIDICPVISNADAAAFDQAFYKDVFITITEKNTQTELIRQLPLSLLNSDMNRLFIDKIIDLPRTFLDISKVEPADKDGKMIYIVFWYDEPMAANLIPEKNNRTEIHSLEITLTGARTYFDDNRTLAGRKVQNLLLSYPHYTPTGKDGMKEVNIINKFLTLKRGQTEFIQRVPLYLFFQTDKNFPLRLQNIIFDLQGSYIETNTVTADDLKTVFFNVIVDDNK